ncbi:MAG: hypothetical protein A3F40_00940 [Chlamydiae bacterium RIFCSPHIGHO2_12_FULL_27_8]|nr:MAG: hypothetical protein A3F40_00940 [Chlamydiae bacterium RIFCSPHIGHO2_12_FULL_27_8]OGN66500.1 MAG: hypothetical protein A2888_00370 [Chlamydiae bacterium RIFCSPLOWO2_01_FULL_28_7]
MHFQIEHPYISGIWNYGMPLIASLSFRALNFSHGYSSLIGIGIFLINSISIPIIGGLNLKPKNIIDVKKVVSKSFISSDDIEKLNLEKKYGLTHLEKKILLEDSFVKYNFTNLDFFNEFISDIIKDKSILEEKEKKSEIFFEIFTAALILKLVKRDDYLVRLYPYISEKTECFLEDFNEFFKNKSSNFIKLEDFFSPEKPKEEQSKNTDELVIKDFQKTIYYFLHQDWFLQIINNLNSDS